MIEAHRVRLRGQLVIESGQEEGGGLLKKANIRVKPCVDKEEYSERYKRKRVNKEEKV